MTSSDRTLRDLLRTDGRLSFDRAGQILADVAGALAPVHATGQAHGAITPQAVHLDADGRARLGPPVADTMAAALLPPAYLAPERMAGEAASPGSDIYALGLVGWEMLTGQTPWVGDSLQDVVLHQRERDLPRLTTVRPGVPRPLLLAIEGALHKHPGDRWSGAGEMLAAVRGPEGIVTPPPVPPTPVDAVPIVPAHSDRPVDVIHHTVPSTRVRPSPHAGRRLATAALVLAVLVSGAAALVSLQGRSRARATAPWMDSVATSTSAGVLITDDTTRGSGAPVHGNRARRVSDVAALGPPNATAFDSSSLGQPAVDDEVSIRARQAGDSIVDEARARAGLPRLERDSTRRRMVGEDSATRPAAATDQTRRPATTPDSASKPETSGVGSGG